MAILKARENSSDTFTPVATMGVGNASQSQRGLMTAQDKVKLDTLVNLLVPVGVILTFASNIDPNNIYAGTTWEKIEGKFLLGSSSSYALGSTGGSANAVVVQHKHFVVGGNAGQGAIEISSGTSFAVNNFFYSSSAAGGGYLLRYTPNGPTYADRGNSSLEGVDGTGKNMPPYEVVNYWKRTA